MQPLYRCEYCDFTGTYDEVKQHEETCGYDYNKRSCFTCQYRKGNTKYQCEAGRDIPAGKMWTQCSLYERDEDTVNRPYKANDFFGGFFRF